VFDIVDNIDFEEKNIKSSENFQLKFHSAEHYTQITPGPHLILKKCDDSSDFLYDYKFNGDNMAAFRKCALLKKGTIDEKLPEPLSSDSSIDAAD
jgi:hypothetical protein